MVRGATPTPTGSKETSRGIINGTPVTADVALAYNDFWWDRGTKVVGNRRTSLIVDPPDGRIPALTAEAKKRLEALDERRERPAEGPKTAASANAASWASTPARRGRPAATT